MLCRSRQLKRAIRAPRKLSRLTGQARHALLYPSKTPVFPFQSFISTVRAEDEAVISRLNVREAAVFYLRSEQEISEVDPQVLDLFREAKEELTTLLEEQKAEAKDKEKGRRRPAPPVPKYHGMKKESLIGQGLALTLDDNFQEFYNLGEKMEEGMAFSSIKSLEEVHATGSLCSMVLTPQEILQKRRCLITFEGIDRIKLVKELQEVDLEPFFERVKDEKITELKEKLENATKLHLNNQIVTANTETIKAELDRLAKEKINMEETMETMFAHNLKIIEYKYPTKELFTNVAILDKILEEIWGVFSELSSKTSLKFQRLKMLNESDQVDLICAYIANKIIVPKHIVQMLMEIDNPLEKAIAALKLLQKFKETYLSRWTEIAAKSTKPKTQAEAKEQIDELYSYMKKIQEESSSPSKKALIKKVRKALDTKHYSKELRAIILEELEKLQEISESFHEFQLIKEFLDLICELPYGVVSQDNFDLKRAKEILDEDHYGMEKVKEKILEFIAVSKLRKTTKGKNLLLVGPPGTGKTSIASSIAKCLNREFVRISLGGESDVALIKGHRKTYIGAYPGKLVMALKQAKTENPVILLDEIDKTSISYKGNIQDTLLEVLDPAQNHSFKDNFLEAPLDLSKVLFVCSANLLDTISEPLLDRLEVIELSGYTMNEKKSIAKSYLIPKAIKSKGLVDYKVEIPDETLEFIIDRYAREAGVRSLEKRINRICEKVCLKIVEEGQKEFLLQPNEVKKYIGPAVFSSDRLYPIELPRGVSIGLSYSSLGGGILFIETAKATFPQELQFKEDISKTQIPVDPSQPPREQLPTEDAKKAEPMNKGGSVTITGQLGNVMQESTQIAHTFAKSVCYSMFDNKFLEDNNVHVHFPEGASKKDGPSAGITITTALVSLATGVPIPGDIGMTGEISLNGKVLKIGGLKEKSLAAKREGLKKIIVPEANRADVEEMKDEVKSGLEFFFVQDYLDVMRIMFPSLVTKPA